MIDEQRMEFEQQDGFQEIFQYKNQQDLSFMFVDNVKKYLQHQYAKHIEGSVQQALDSNSIQDKKMIIKTFVNRTNVMNIDVCF